MKGQFSRFGIPDSVMSDNGPQFASAEFRTFAQEYEFSRVTSSPGFASSNGQIEKNNKDH